MDLEIRGAIRYDGRVTLSEEGGAHVEYHVDYPNVRVRRPARYAHLTLPITSASSR
jgi:archaeosine-15-forming tRNA-guanine transglycosylase